MDIKKTDKILNITHKDLDGCGASIVLSNVFKNHNIQYYSVGYPEIDSVLNTLHYEIYDKIILTDVSPVKDPSLIDRSSKIYLIDHHDSALKYHNPEKFRFVSLEKCATSLVKDYFEKQSYCPDISYLNDFVNVVNGYDMWIHDDMRSKELNSLYFKYWDEKFRKRFMGGDLIFNEDEIEYIKEQKRKFDEVWKNLNVYQIQDINGVFTSSGEFINDICDRLLNERGYDFIFCLNNKSKVISARTKRDDINLGHMFEILKIGGGHAKAAGIDPRPTIELNNVIDLCVETILEELKNNKGN